MYTIAGDDDDDRSRNSASRNHEERSRSSWADVVSSGQKEEAEGEPESDYGRRQNHRNSRTQEAEEIRNDGNWDVVGSKQQQQQQALARRPYKQVAAETRNGYKRPANEQKYVDDATHGLYTEPTREELEDLSRACNRLWDLDINRLEPGKDYVIDCGEGKKVYQKGDMASASLFSWLSDDTFRRPTYSRFCCLLNNYNPNEGVREVVTAEEKHEQAAFIEEISRTAPIKYLHQYLVYKDIVSSNYEDFKEMLSHLWFDLHGRGGGSNCSSAFEHVFVGEIKGRGETEVSGFHNWIQFYLEEAKGRVEYQGYIFPRRRGQSPDSETQLLTVQFEWNGVMKSVSSTLVGVSPEFEIALYTLCFFVGGEDNAVSLGPYSVNVKCYRLGNNRIGSAFPVAEC